MILDRKQNGRNLREMWRWRRSNSPSLFWKSFITLGHLMVAVSQNQRPWWMKSMTYKPILTILELSLNRFRTKRLRHRLLFRCSMLSKVQAQVGAIHQTLLLFRSRLMNLRKLQIFHRMTICTQFCKAIIHRPKLNLKGSFAWLHEVFRFRSSNRQARRNSVRNGTRMKMISRRWQRIKWPSTNTNGQSIIRLHHLR